MKKLYDFKLMQGGGSIALGKVGNSEGLYLNHIEFM